MSGAIYLLFSVIHSLDFCMRNKEPRFVCHGCGDKIEIVIDSPQLGRIIHETSDKCSGFSITVTRFEKAIPKPNSSSDEYVKESWP